MGRSGDREKLERKKRSMFWQAHVRSRLGRLRKSQSPKSVQAPDGRKRRTSLRREGGLWGEIACWKLAWQDPIAADFKVHTQSDKMPACQARFAQRVSQSTRSGSDSSASKEGYDGADKEL